MARNIDFEMVAYEYFKEDYPCNTYSLEELKDGLDCKEKQMDNGLVQASNSFRNAKNDLQKDFKDFLRLFRVEDFAEDFKENRKYVFDEEDKNFIVSVMNSYRKTLIWKKEIKKICDYEQSSFLDMYIKTDNPRSMAEEIFTVVEGLGKMHEKCSVSSERKEAFKRNLCIGTQYWTIKWIVDLRKVIDTAVYPSREQVEKSVDGILLDDYKKWLECTREHIKNYLLDEGVKWVSLVLERENEYWSMLERFDAEEDELVGRYMREAERKIEEEKLHKKQKEQKEPKKARIAFGREKQIWMEVIEKMGKEHPELLRKLAQNDVRL